MFNSLPLLVLLGLYRRPANPRLTQLRQTRAALLARYEVLLQFETVSSDYPRAECRRVDDQLLEIEQEIVRLEAKEQPAAGLCAGQTTAPKMITGPGLRRAPLKRN